MAIVPKTDVPATVAQEALSTAPTPAAKPDLSGYSKDDLRGMLKADQVGSNGNAAPELTQPEPPPETKQPERAKAPPPQDLQVPDKFRNPDGSVNQEALLKSYLESEKVIPKQMQALHSMDTIKNENQELRQQIESLMEFKNNYEAERQAAEQEEATQTLTAEELAQLTPEQQQEYFREAARAEIRSEVQKIEAQREMDNKIQASIADVSKMEGYEHLKGDINNLLKADFMDYHPDSPRVAYFAALGQKTPDLVVQAKNMGFSEGYAKAKEEMGKMVDTGKSSAPINIEGMSPDQLKKLSKEDLGRMVPRYSDDTYTIR